MRARTDHAEPSDDFREFFETAAIGMAESDGATGLFVRVNPGCCGMLGFRAEELVGQRTMADVTLDADRVVLEHAHRRLLASEIPACSTETRFVRKNGTVVWARTFTTLTRRADGTPKTLLNIIEDITEHQHGEDQLRLALELGDVGTWDWDATTGRTLCSPAHFRLYGLDPDSRTEPLTLTLDDWLAMVHSDDRARVSGGVERARIAGWRYADEFRAIWPNGTIRWLAARGTIERDATGAFARMVGITIDITPQLASATIKAPPDVFALRTYADGDMILWQGARTGNFLQIISGTVKIQKLLPSGRNQILGFQRAGDIIGFADGETYAHFAQAIGSVVTRRLPISEKDTRGAAVTSVLHRLAAGAIQGLMESHEHVTLLGTPSARRRLLRFLLNFRSSTQQQNPDEWISLPMSRQDIGDYLALRRETVSRILGDLEQERVIELAHRKVRLVDLDQIAAEIDGGE